MPPYLNKMTLLDALCHMSQYLTDRHADVTVIAVGEAVGTRETTRPGLDFYREPRVGGPRDDLPERRSMSYYYCVEFYQLFNTADTWCNSRDPTIPKYCYVRPRLLRSSSFKCARQTKLY
jgi:hypothetical protein